ncbi:MAG: nuclease-related domain-containing protein [Moraxella sp.]|nr:nuclease-related domain-containing protein [Moraxella sp.]
MLSLFITLLIIATVIAFIFSGGNSSSLSKKKDKAGQKGTTGERLVALESYTSLNLSTYIPFHNIAIYNGETTTQIDHIYLSIYGIFVLETKHYSGWIYGGQYNKYWTQTFKSKKHQFKNPIHQNYGHIKFLENFLTIEFEKFHSVIVFSGDSEFKTALPKNVCSINNFCDYILSFNRPIFTQNEIENLANFLRSRTLPQTDNTLNFHIHHIKK